MSNKAITLMQWALALFVICLLGSTRMLGFFQSLKGVIAAACLAAVPFGLSACTTARLAPAADFQFVSGAINVPYRISESGRLLVDVSVNGGPLRPLSVDTGATVSVIYGDYAKTANLKVSDETVFVRGLVGQGDRPIIEDVTFKIGPSSFPLDQVVMLELPFIKDEAIGLLGGDILGRYTALFDKVTMTASFVPRDNVTADAFEGWNAIPLKTLTESTTDTQLYFAQTMFDGKSVPVLIDTGSNLNFINWQLAKMDTDIRKLERRLRRDGTLQGALETTSLTTETKIFDLKLGADVWDEIDVTVMDLNSLSTVAPIDQPMIVAGVGVFSPHSFAVDLVGGMIYIQPQSKRQKSKANNRDVLPVTDNDGRRILDDLVAVPPQF